MSRVNIRQAHSRSLDEVREIVRKVADQLQRKSGLKSSWQTDDCVHFRRAGVGGELHIRPTEVTIDLDLGILLGAYARKIKQELQREMAERLE